MGGRGSVQCRTGKGFLAGATALGPVGPGSVTHQGGEPLERVRDSWRSGPQRGICRSPPVHTCVPTIPRPKACPRMCPELGKYDPLQTRLTRPNFQIHGLSGPQGPHGKEGSSVRVRQRASLKGRGVSAARPVRWSSSGGRYGSFLEASAEAGGNRGSFCTRPCVLNAAPGSAYSATDAGTWSGSRQ
jgi:hypothetical protein